MRVKLDPADIIFSIYIRLRDGRCMRCGRRPDRDRFGRPVVGLQASHYFGRANESTRFEERNADSLCCGCHRIWGSDDREAYREFKINQLGQAGFDQLVLQKHLPVKKDRKMAFIYWTARVKEEFGKMFGGIGRS